jgi:hypothetical protein
VVSFTTPDVVVHSFTPLPSAPAAAAKTLQEVLDSMDDKSMWKRFYFDDDGS